MVSGSARRVAQYVRVRDGSSPPEVVLSWHVAALTLDNLDDLPKRCRRCVFWELSENLSKQAAEDLLGKTRPRSHPNDERDRIARQLTATASILNCVE